MKEKIKMWYNQNLWTLDMVKNSVIKKLITADDYKEITNFTFEKE